MNTQTAVPQYFGQRYLQAQTDTTGNVVITYQQARQFAKLNHLIEANFLAGNYRTVQDTMTKLLSKIQQIPNTAFKQAFNDPKRRIVVYERLMAAATILQRRGMGTELVVIPN